MSNEKSSPHHNIRLAGLLLIAVGVILLLKQMGFVFPAWLTSWPMILIVVGLAMGTLTLFRNPAWLIPVSIGSVFLLDRLYPDADILRLAGPVAIIAFGLWIIFGRNSWLNCTGRTGKDRTGNVHTSPPHWERHDQATLSPDSGGESVDAVSVFSGVQKRILSKNFKGGEIVTFMGGVEIDLSQADIQGRVTLDVTQVMGGTKLIIPPHWGVSSEMVAVLGGIEDKRMHQVVAPIQDKVLVIVGTSVLGGIEIHSYG